MARGRALGWHSGDQGSCPSSATNSLCDPGQVSLDLGSQPDTGASHSQSGREVTCGKAWKMLSYSSPPWREHGERPGCSPLSTALNTTESSSHAIAPCLVPALSTTPPGRVNGTKWGSVAAGVPKRHPIPCFFEQAGEPSNQPTPPCYLGSGCSRAARRAAGSLAQHCRRERQPPGVGWGRHSRL